MKNYLKKAETIDVVATANGTGGSLLVVGAMPCIAVRDHVAGETVGAMVEGGFELPKVAGAVTQGQVLYALAAGGSVTTDPNGGANPKVGFAMTAAAGGDATVSVKFSI